MPNAWTPGNRVLLLLLLLSSFESPHAQEQQEQHVQLDLYIRKLVTLRVATCLYLSVMMR